MKMNLTCDHCGKHYTSYQCGKYHHFCSIECRRKAGKLVAESFTQETRDAKAKQFTEMNRTLMLEPQYVEKRRQKLKANKPTTGYTKHHGRHEHRVIAEEKIGRKLKRGEIVHHIDGNKANNHPDNLQVMTQSEHIKLHLGENKRLEVMPRDNSVPTPKDSKKKANRT